MAARIRQEHQESVISKIKTSQLINRLQNHIDGKIELEQTQIKAIEMLLARTMPTLSAVEQTNIEPEKALSEADLLAKMGELIAAYPDLAQRAIGEYARKQHDAKQQSADTAVASTPQVISK
jgi:hypothetical protein